MGEQEGGRDRPLRETETAVDLARRLAPGTLVAGRYKILALVGLGGMGVVYRARDEELGVEVALKVLRPDLGTDPEWVDRFRRELVLAREVTHKNVVRIHDIGESGGLRFLTMRYVEGRSLQKVLDEGGPLPLERALRIVRQLAEALENAHGAGIVHRDLKPANVLLEADDTAYVTDFGIARSLAGAGFTRTGAIVGTPEYLSPEQAAGEAVDGRADLYALGILFYEMLTRELPFRGGSQAEMLAQRLTGRIRDIEETGVSVPAWVGGVIRRCLERSPSRRYASARELLEDLDRERASRAPAAVLRWQVALPAALLLLAGGWAASRAGGGLSFLTRLARPTATPEAVTARSIVVLPLADDTGDPGLAWASAGIAEMLTARLAESADLRVLDSLRVLRTLKDLRLADGRYDEAGLRRLGEILEVECLVAGSVRRAGGTVRVDLRLVSVGPGGALSTHSVAAEAPDAGGLFGVVADLGRRLRQDLGAAPPVAAEAAGPGTSSLEAARAYREGRERLMVTDYVGAAPALERAVAADPGFAEALERLAESYQGLGYQEKALDAAERAARAAGAAPTRLGYRIRARLALLKGDPGEAVRSYEELARRYPNDSAALLDLASAHAAQGDVARAVETLKRASAVDRNDPRIWYLLGRNTIMMGDAAKAVSNYLVRALALQSQLHNEQGQADVENAMGIAHHELGDYAQAIEKYSAAAAKRKHLGDERGVAASLKNRARTYVAMGRFTEAEPDLTASGQIYERIGDQSGRADVWNELGVLHEGRGELGPARKAYQEALRIRRGLGDERSLAQSYDNVGYIFFLEGEYESALVYAQQALERRRKIGDQGGAVQSQQTIGFIQTALGRWAEALKTFLDALEKAREIDFKNAMAVSHGNIGVLQQHEGRYAAALASLDEALALLKSLDDKRGLAEFTLKEAGVMLELGRLEAAKAKLDAAEPLLREVANHEQSSDYHVLLGEWQARKGGKAAAARAFAQAVAEATASRSQAALLRARLAQAEGAGDVGALVSLAKGADALGDALLVIRTGEAVVQAQLSRGRAREAEEAARKALKLAQRCGWESGLYRLHAVLGRILEKKGDRAGAAAEYKAGAREIAKLREGLTGELRTSFDALATVREVEALARRHAEGSGRGV